MSKKREIKEYVLYSYDNVDGFDDAKEYLERKAVEDAEDNGGVPKRVGDQDVYASLAENNSCDWEEISAAITKHCENQTGCSYLVVHGESRRWNGSSTGGTIFHTWDDIIRHFSGYDFTLSEDSTGEFELSVHHYDATNTYTLRFMTKKGVEWWERQQGYVTPDTTTHLMSVRCYTKRFNFRKSEYWYGG